MRTSRSRKKLRFARWCPSTVSGTPVRMPPGGGWMTPPPTREPEDVLKSREQCLSLRQRLRDARDARREIRVDELLRVADAHVAEQEEVEIRALVSVHGLRHAVQDADAPAHAVRLPLRIRGAAALLHRDAHEVELGTRRLLADAPLDAIPGLFQSALLDDEVVERAQAAQVIHLHGRGDSSQVAHGLEHARAV